MGGCILFTTASVPMINFRLGTLSNMLFFFFSLFWIKFPNNVECKVTMTRVYKTMRQLNKPQTTSVINIIKPLSKTIMKMLTLDSRKPSVHNRISGSFGCLVMSLFSICCYGLPCWLCLELLLMASWCCAGKGQIQEIHHKMWKNLDESFLLLKYGH